MPFKPLLKELVESVDGATGALLLGADGEAVQWHARDDGERLRLRGAYVAVALQSSRALALHARLGDTGCLVIRYDGASFVAREVETDYYLVIELDESANIGQAIYRIRPAAMRIRREFAL